MGTVGGGCALVVHLSIAASVCHSACVNAASYIHNPDYTVLLHYVYPVRFGPSYILEEAQLSRGDTI